MSLVNAFTHNRSLNTHCVVLMAQGHSVTLLLIKNPLSHKNENNRRLLEKAIIFCCTEKELIIIITFKQF